MPSDNWNPTPFPLNELLSLEGLLCQLEHCTQTAIVDGEDPPGIIQQLERLESKLSRFEFKDAYHFFQLEMGYLLSQLRIQRRREGGQTQLGNQVNSLHKRVEGIRRSVRRDALVSYAFTAKPLSMESIKSLMEEPFLAFGLPPDPHLSIPHEVLENITEASRCLALGFASAAILFTCLGTEAFVKKILLPARCETGSFEQKWFRIILGRN